MRKTAKQVNQRKYTSYCTRKCKHLWEWLFTGWPILLPITFGNLSYQKDFNCNHLLLSNKRYYKTLWHYIIVSRKARRLKYSNCRVQWANIVFSLTYGIFGIFHVRVNKSYHEKTAKFQKLRKHISYFNVITSTDSETVFWGTLEKY